MGSWDRKRRARRVICVVTLWACIATGAFNAFICAALPAIGMGHALLETCVHALPVVFACGIASVLLVIRPTGHRGTVLRIVTSTICVAATLFAIPMYEEESILCIAPAIAAGVIWLTPGPIPGYLCTSCGYALRHLPTSTCPECGKAMSDAPAFVQSASPADSERT